MSAGKGSRCYSGQKSCIEETYSKEAKQGFAHLALSARLDFLLRSTSLTLRPLKVSCNRWSDLSSTSSASAPHELRTREGQCTSFVPGRFPLISFQTVPLFVISQLALAFSGERQDMRHGSYVKYSPDSIFDSQDSRPREELLRKDLPP